MRVHRTCVQCEWTKKPTALQLGFFRSKKRFSIALLRLFYILRKLTKKQQLMPKYKYVTEYEINAAVKMIYPYLSTPAGLKEWFAEDVQVLPDKTLNIVWDGIAHHARIASWRANAHIRYQFIPEGGEEGVHPRDLAYLELRVDFNEITQTSFLKITDYSDMDNDDELLGLWDNLIEQLREVLGAAVND
jgi:uncharacterized protein YndB with AHSA1/START domain